MSVFDGQRTGDWQVTVEALEFMCQALFLLNTSTALNDVREALAATGKCSQQVMQRALYEYLAADELLAEKHNPLV